MSVYRPQGVIFLGIGTNDPGTAGSTLLFAKEYNYDFPIGFDTASIFRNYQSQLENYFVIGPDGKITFRAIGTARATMPWSTIEPALKQAIETALLTPVQEETWGRIKALYR